MAYDYVVDPPPFGNDSQENKRWAYEQFQRISGNMLSNPPLLITVEPPATAADDGLPGDYAWDASYLYLCTARNTWRRIAHSTW